MAIVMDVFISQPCNELLMFFLIFKIHQHIFPPDTRFDDEWYIDAQKYIVKKDDSGPPATILKSNKVAPAVAAPHTDSKAKASVTLTVLPVSDTKSTSEIELVSSSARTGPSAAAPNVTSTPWSRQSSRRQGSKVAAQPKKRRQSIFEQMSALHKQMASSESEVKTEDVKSETAPYRPPARKKKPMTRRKSVFSEMQDFFANNNRSGTS